MSDTFPPGDDLDAADLPLDDEPAEQPVDTGELSVGDLVAAPDGRVGQVLAVHRGAERPDDAGDDWQRPVIVGWFAGSPTAWDPPDSGLVKYEAPTGQED